MIINIMHSVFYCSFYHVATVYHYGGEFLKGQIVIDAQDVMILSMRNIEVDCAHPSTTSCSRSLFAGVLLCLLFSV